MRKETRGEMKDSVSGRGGGALGGLGFCPSARRMPKTTHRAAMPIRQAALLRAGRLLPDEIVV